jgi:hypothetical protein
MLEKKLHNGISIIYGDHIEEDRISRSCSIHVKCILGFSRKA